MNLFNFFYEYWFEIFAPLILIVGTFLIYYNSESELKKKIIKILPLIIITSFWIVIRKLWNNTLIHWKCWDIWFMIFIAVYFIGIFWMYYEKYSTEGYVLAEGCPPACFSTDPVRIGKYTIFNCGSSNKTFRVEEGDFILVVPTKSITWYGSKAVCNVQVTRRDIFGLPYKLPESVSNYILNEKNLNKNCIYFGLFDKNTLLYGKPFTIKGTTYSYKEFEEEFCSMNYRIDMLREYADGRTDLFEKSAQHMKRFTKSLVGKNQFSIKKDKTNEDEFGD